MAIATKPNTKKHVGKKAEYPPLPPSANVVDLGGRKYMISPLDEYDDWLQDALLAAIAEERLKNQSGESISFEEFEARLDAKKKRR